MKNILVHVVLRNNENIYEHIHESVIIETKNGEICTKVIMEALINKGLPFDVREFNIIIVGFNNC